MTTNFSETCGNKASKNFSVEAQGASTDLHLGVSENLVARALKIIEPALADWAERKNLLLAQEGLELAARFTLEKILPEMIGPLIAFDPAALIEMRRAIFFTLDVYAVMRLGYCLAELEGKEFPDPMRALAIAESTVASGYALAADPLDPVIWGDLMEMAAKQRLALQSGQACETDHG